MSPVNQQREVKLMVQTAALAQATVLARFRLRGDDNKFVDVFAERIDHLRRASGFVRTVLLRSVRDPRSYASVGTWTDEWSYRTAARDARFARHVYGPLNQLVDSEIDRTTLVDAGQADGVQDVLRSDRPAVALTTFALKRGVDPLAFEQGFVAHSAFVRAQDGYLAHELTLLSNRARTYVNLGWWRDKDAYLAVLRSQTMRADAKTMAGLVDASGELFETVASYEPAS
ncbi:MAG: hypothetical protein AUI14_05265 [Actinobacteria bacterium 13_2_20CM_2_71_6]|nr:MAG: hypothetical protein AUI14_05265 [Actinobacteria bacterium 13_2_20CM_2_71_6]